jgi:hypothetical protein
MQLGLGLLLAVLLPWAVRVQIEIEELALVGLQNSLAGTASGACPAFRG